MTSAFTHLLEGASPRVRGEGFGRKAETSEAKRTEGEGVPQVQTLRRSRRAFFVDPPSPIAGCARLVASGGPLPASCSDRTHAGRGEERPLVKKPPPTPNPVHSFGQR